MFRGMAQKTVLVLICDSCGTDGGDGNGGVTEHKLSVDGNSWRIDACTACWSGHFRDLIKPLTVKGYGVRVRGRKAAAAQRALRAV